MRKLIFLFSAVILLMTSCSSKTDTTLQNGTWRGELEVKEQWAPFIFEVSSDNNSTTVTLINGEERVELTGVYFSDDSVYIPIESYDAFIGAKINNGKLSGKFVKNYIENDPGVSFRAEYNQTARFQPATNPSDIKIDGKWDIGFINEKGDTTRNVGVFKTNGATVTGSVLTNSGDLRFLEGIYTENGAQLSAFGGLSPYLIEIDFTDNDHFDGKFYTTRGITKLSGTRNEHAGLTDPYTLTKLKPGFKSLSFKLPNIDGEEISINDERYQGKVIIVSILGSWCPNCLDEMEYLSPWYKENKDRGVEIIGLAYERKDDFEYAQGTLSRLKEKYDVDYEILFAGQIGDKAIAASLPEVDKITSYPTTIYIDKKGEVRKIHTGFNGPATGLFYEEFKQDFNALIDLLLSE